MKLDQLLKRLGADTAEVEDAVARVEARLKADRAQTESVTRLLRALPEPDRGANERVAARLRATMPLRTRPGTLGVLAPVVGGMAAAAAIGAVVARLWTPDTVALADAPLSAPLASPEVFQVYAPGNGVAVSFAGTGNVAGSQAAPRVAWDQGTLNVEVPPGRGIDLRVETREAAVHVIGTGFSVTRGALGTRVDVRHGTVEVRCTGESAALQRVEAGGTVTCLPSGGAGLLARARKLAEDGAADAEVLTTLDAAMAAGGGGAIGTEVRAFRAERRARIGDAAGALEDAAAALADGGGGRREELLQLASAEALQLGGCATARPWLEQLVATGAANASATGWHAACQADPHAADGLRSAPR